MGKNSPLMKSDSAKEREPKEERREQKGAAHESRDGAPLRGWLSDSYHKETGEACSGIDGKGHKENMPAHGAHHNYHRGGKD